tara:strand:+ start:1693 stop:2664 length:972 start_codon:yes stop_codon:yes gene_type:complete
MAPSDTPINDDEDLNAGNASVDQPSVDENGHQVTLEEIPELDREDLRADTLEFEQINRRAKPKGRGSKLLIILLIIGGGGYAAWSQWGDELLGRNVDELPVVHAPEAPLKVRPEAPGGIDIPNRDKLVYDRLEKKPPEEKTENLLPRPEVPLTPPAPKPQDKAEVTPQPEPKEEIEPEEPKSAGSPPTTEEVKAVKKPEPAPEPPKIEKPVVKVEPKPAEPVKAAPVKLVTPVTKPITKQSYQIQLAAVRNADAAKREWARLQKKYDSVLGPLSLNVERADLGKKGIFYRLRAGPVTDLAAAKSLCQSLAKLKVGCLVIRPGR